MNRQTSNRRRRQVKYRRRLQFEQVEMRCLLAVGLPGLVSVDATETKTGSASSSIARQSLSANGRFEVFTSSADDLVAGATDSNGASDVFLRDTLSGETKLISTAMSGTTGNGASDQPVMSADGRFVAFRSSATDLGTADTNANADVFIWERTTGKIVLASANIDGDDGGNGDSSSPSISGDGAIVAFVSAATDLVAGFVDRNGADADIFVRDATAAETALVSSNASGTATGESFSFDPIVSKDGSTIVFTSLAGDLVAGVVDVNGVEDIYAYDVASGNKQALSLETNGNVSGNDQSSVENRQTTSDEGRYHVFTSLASNLDAGVVDDNQTSDVFLFDTFSGVTTLVSATPLDRSGNAASDQPVISADGNFVAFRSIATNFGTADSNSDADIFLWNRTTGVITLVSPNAAGDDGGNGGSFGPSISGDGSIVAFVSLATDLVAGIDTSASISDVYVRDTVADTTALASSNRDETAVGNNRSFNPIVSEDSSTVVFESISSDLVPGIIDNNLVIDVFAYDVATRSKEALSVELSGNFGGNQGSTVGPRQTISDDGRYQVFTSSATNVNGDSEDTNASDDVYLFDSVLGVKTLISATPLGTTGDGASDQPVISADGNFVAFRSAATDFGTVDTNNNTDIYLWERSTGNIALLSFNLANDNGGEQNSFSPSISGDGSIVAFASLAGDLVPGINNANASSSDIYVRLVSANTTLLASANQSGTATGDASSFAPLVSDDGSSVIFESRASNLVTGVVDNNNDVDIFAYDVVTGATEAISLEISGNVSGNDRSAIDDRHNTSDNGRYHVFTSDATNLDANTLDTNGVTDIFLFDAVSGVTKLISATASGTSGNGESDQPVISGDGNFVAFRSTAIDLEFDDFDDRPDIFLWERATGTISLISINSTGVNSGNDISFDPSINGDGSVVAFVSRATDLVSGIDYLNSQSDTDVFVRDVTTSTTMLASSNQTGTATGNARSIDPIVSKDGRTVVFESDSNDLVANFLDFNNQSDVYAFNVALQETEAINIELDGNVSGNRFSSHGTRQTTSDDGRYHVFVSDSNNLDADVVDSNFGTDVFFFDAVTGVTKLISATPSGESGNGISSEPVISADGRFVAFQSDASNFVISDDSSNRDIFLWDSTTGMLTLISTNASGTSSGNNSSFTPSISGDGSIVAFESRATDLVDGITDLNGSIHDVFVRDVLNGTTLLASVNSAGTGTGDSESREALISQDGSAVVFRSEASDLDALVSDTSGLDLFVRHLSGPESNTTETITVMQSDPSVSSAGYSRDSADISNDGAIVAFGNSNDTLVSNDSNLRSDIFVRNVTTNVTELVSVNDFGSTTNNASSGSPRISGDGTTVVFTSTANNLAAPDTDFARDIFARDLQTGTTELISVSADGTSGGLSSSNDPTVSDDGRFVAFTSWSTNLVNGLTDTSQDDVFLRDRLNDQTVMVSVDVGKTGEGNGESADPFLSGDGSRVVFVTDATNLIGAGFVDLNRQSEDVYSHTIDPINLSLDTNELVSRKALGIQIGGDNRSSTPDVSDDGRFVVFESHSSTLTAETNASGTLEFAQDIFVRDRQVGVTELISISNTGTTPGQDSANPDLSGDGNFVTFESDSGNIAAPDTDSGLDVFLRDRGAGTTELISISLDGTSGASASNDAKVSDDGRFVLFKSRSRHIVDLDNANSQVNVYLRDTIQNQTVLINIDSTGTQHDNNQSIDPSLIATISPMGNVIVFESIATNLIDSDFIDLNDRGIDIYRHAIIPADISQGSNQLVSKKAIGLINTAHKSSINPDVSNDGQVLTFESRANGLTANDTNFQPDVFVRDRTLATTDLISINTLGSSTASTRDSDQPRISGDGNSIAFRSSAPDLVSPNTPGLNIYVRNLSLGSTELISVSTSGTGGSSDSSQPSLSDDGRFVVFQSFAQDLVDGVIIIGIQQNLYLRDVVDQQTSLISIDSDRTSSGNRGSTAPFISGNGSQIIYESDASNLVGADFIDINGSGNSDVYLHSVNSSDISLGTNIIVSRKAVGTDFTVIPGGVNPDVSDNGQIVVFESRSVLLTPDASVSNNPNIFLRDRSTDTTELVSVSRFGNRHANSSSEAPSVSGDGNSVLFTSRSTDLTINTVSNSVDDIFLRNISAGTTELVTVDRNGQGADRNSNNYSISDDGRFVAFESRASDLVASGLTSGLPTNVFLRDTTANQTALVSIDSDRTAEAVGFSSRPSISADGSRVLFQSTAMNLINSDFADLNGPGLDIYSHLIDPTDITLGENQLVSGKAAGLLMTGNHQSRAPDVSDDGKIVAFESLASHLTGSDTNSHSDVFVRNRFVDTTELVSINSAGSGPGNLASTAPRVSGDGITIVFQSLASDLSSIDTGFRQDIFARQRDTATTELISVNNSAADGGNFASQDASVSDDGRFVVFTSLATDLVPSGVTTSQPNVYFRDRQETTVELVSQNSLGSNDGNGDSFQPQISDNGTTVVFVSDATDLVSGIADANDAVDIFFVLNTGIVDVSIVAVAADRPEGDSGTAPFTFQVTRSGDTSGSTTVDIHLFGNGQNPADDEDFDGITAGPGNANFSNRAVPLDASNDGVVTARDALLVLNTLYRNGADPTYRPDTSASGYVDPSGDDTLSAHDALVIINAIGRDSQPPIVSVDSGTDGMISGTVTDQTGVARLVAVIDDTAVIELPFNSDGTFAFHGAHMLSRFGGGEHRLSLVAVDGRGNQSSPQEFLFAGAAAGTDPTASIATTAITFAAGETTKFVTVQVNGDIDVEADEGFTVLLNPSGNDVLVNQATARGIVRNDDIPSIEVEQIVYFNEDSESELELSPEQNGQRSIIRRVQVRFAGPVDVALGPITDDSFVAESIDLATVGDRVALEVLSSELINGRQVVVLGFAGTEFIESVSQNQSVTRPMLVDGSYRLTVHGSLLGIDANGDGVGDDRTDDFFRLFGDSDGDGDTDSSDAFRFRQHSTSGSDNQLFDFDADEQLSDPDDLHEFFTRLGKTI